MYYDHLQQADYNKVMADLVQRKIKEVQSDPNVDYSTQSAHDERCVIALIVHGLHN